jgi:hypothetical protein
MIPEAPLEQTDTGLVPVGPGWFVLNARDARWNERPKRRGLTFTGSDDWDADWFFPQLGVNLAVLEPGEPNSMYHWETETEAFLVHRAELRALDERSPAEAGRDGHRPNRRALCGPRRDRRVGNGARALRPHRHRHRDGGQDR